jgi:hypothetical protein
VVDLVIEGIKFYFTEIGVIVYIELKWHRINRV